MFGTDSPTTYETGRFRLAADSNFAQASFNVYRQEFRHLGGFEAQKMTLPNVATTIGRTLAENAPVIASGATERFSIFGAQGPNDALGRAILLANGDRISNTSANRGFFALASRDINTFEISNTGYTLGGPADFDVADNLDLGSTYDSVKGGDSYSELDIAINNVSISAVIVFFGRNNNARADFYLLASSNIADTIQLTISNQIVTLTKLSSNSGYSINGVNTGVVVYRAQSANVGGTVTRVLDIGVFTSLIFRAANSPAGLSVILNNVKVSQHLAANQSLKFLLLLLLVLQRPRLTLR